LHWLGVREYVEVMFCNFSWYPRHVQGAPSKHVQVGLEEHEELLLTPGIKCRSDLDESVRLGEV
jgi:hypothetical protein